MMTCWACSKHVGLVEKARRMLSCEAFDSGYEQRKMHAKHKYASECIQNICFRRVSLIDRPYVIVSYASFMHSFIYTRHMQGSGD